MVSNSMSKLAKRKFLRNTFGLTITEAKSFEAIVALIDEPTTPVTVTASYIAEVLEVSQPTSHKTVRNLVARGLLLTGRVKYQFFINPEAFNIINSNN